MKCRQNILKCTRTNQIQIQAKSVHMLYIWMSKQRRNSQHFGQDLVFKEITCQPSKQHWQPCSTKFCNQHSRNNLQRTSGSIGYIWKQDHEGTQTDLHESIMLSKLGLKYSLYWTLLYKELKNKLCIFLSTLPELVDSAIQTRKI